jgi:hypothetical protein
MRTDFCRSEIGAPPRSTPSAGRWQRRLRSPPAPPAPLQQLLLVAMLATKSSQTPPFFWMLLFNCRVSVDHRKHRRFLDAAVQLPRVGRLYHQDL